MLVRLAVHAIDLFILLALGVLVGIALTGGGEWHFRDVTFSFHRIGNGLLALGLLIALRLRLWPSAAFLGRRGWRPDEMGERARQALARAIAWFDAGMPRRALAVVVAMAIASLIARLAIAVGHPGFFSGDDVEIHEMTFSALFGTARGTWDLRSAFYPFAFIYPVQRALVGVGVTAPEALVVAGRVVVACVSVLLIPIAFRFAHRTYGPGPAVIAAILLSANALLVTFGGTELPRPIAGVFVLGAFVCLQHPSRAALAGVLVGMAGAMRFSEIVFIVPAAIQLLIERRRTSLVAFLASALGTAALIQVTADLLYWGRPFSSLAAAVDYTLLRAESSRGFQPAWFYLTDLAGWIDPAMAFFAALALRAHWRLALWALVPLATLSLLPHKEPRYLVPMTPFVLLAAALGIWSGAKGIVAAGVERSRAGLMALIGIALVAGSLLFQVSGWHVRRSDEDVRLARALGPAVTGDVVAVEQAWRVGGRVYLRDARAIVDLDPGRLRTPEDLAGIVRAHSPNLLLLLRSSCARLSCSQALPALGLRPYADAPGDSGYVVFAR